MNLTVTGRSITLIYLVNQGDAMTKSTTIKVKEIHCTGCENTISTALNRLPGVRHVIASSIDNKVKLTFEEDKIDEPELRKKLAEIGYEPLEKHTAG